MKPSQIRVNLLGSVITLAVSLPLLTQSSAAAEITWDGEANTNTLAPAVNWQGDVAPVSGDSLLFNGATGATLINGYAANTVFAGISFNATAGNFVIGQTANPVIDLGGNISNASIQPQSINNPLALTTTRSVGVTSQYGSLSLGGLISGTGFGFTKTGAGLLTLANSANTFTGPIVINGGTLAFSADSTGVANQLGSGAGGAASITLNGGALRSTAATQLSSNRGIILGASGGSFGQFNNNITTYNGVISGGANNFTKTGQGTFELGGISTYTGSTSVDQGTLRLNFSNIVANTTNLINSGSPLILGGNSTGLATATTSAAQGPILEVRSKGAATAVSQTFSGLTLNRGFSNIQTTQTASLGDVLLNLGGITRQAGGFVNFSRVGTLSATNSITATTANGVGGILGGWALFGGTDYAANDGTGNIIALAAYTDLAASGSVVSDGAATNVRFNTIAGSGNPTIGAAVTNVNTISNNTASSITVNTTGQTLRLGASGGILIGTAKGPLSIGLNDASRGILTAGGADDTAGEIHVSSQSNAGGVTINSVISNNSTGPVSLRIGNATFGASTTQLNSTANTYTGGTVIASGRLVSANAGIGAGNFAFGSGKVTVLNGGQAYLGGNGVYANDFDVAGAGGPDTFSAIRFQGNNTVSGTITLLGDTIIALRNSTGNSITGRITGGYNLSILGQGAGGGSIILSNPANNYTGNLTIGEERVILGASNVLSNGPGVGNVILNNNTNAFLDLNGFDETINGLISLGGNPFVQNNAASTVSTLTVGDGDASAVFQGVIRDNSGTGGTLALVKIGNGTQYLQGASTYTGGTTVKAGLIFRGANSTNAFGTGPITLGDTTGSASAGLRFSNVGTTTTNPIIVAAGSSGLKTIDTIGSGQAFTFSGNVTLTGNLNVSTFAGNTNAITFNTGVISGTGGLNLSAAGANINLSGANTYSGPTSVTTGTVVIAQPYLANTSTLSIGATGRVQLNYDESGGQVTDVVQSLVIAGVPQPAGVYGATGSGAVAPFIDDVHFAGVGTITVVPGGAGNYATWATANGISGEPASGDFDQDGLTNLVEYALGKDPKVSSQPPGTLSGGILTFTKGTDAIANGDVNFIIEESDDLGISDPWVPVVTPNAPNASTSIAYTLPTGLPKVFARLKVVQNP